MAAQATLRPEDLLITAELYRRPARPPRLESELEAYRELSSLMAVDPSLAIQRFVELAVDLCPAAGSAGLSELGAGPDGEPRFEWTAMAGAFAPYVGGTTPRDFSPCGLCLGHHHTILVDRPARVFTYFDEAEPAIVEGLIVPVYDTGKRPLGTIWVTSHEPGEAFDGTDARIMEQLAVQLVLAIKLRRKTRVLVQLEQVVKDKEILVHEVHHRVKNTIQMTSALLHLQQRGVDSIEAKAALKEAQTRLLVLAKVYEAYLEPTAGKAARIDVRALVETLVSALRETIPSSGRVLFKTLCDSLHLDASEAVPVGLIVNEAVTNALKHGFPDGRTGEIRVELRRLGDRCSLSIRDDGRGFDKPVRDGSLGMRLIQSLARQLRAKLEVSGADGAKVELTWTSVVRSAAMEAEPVLAG
jgi:two-component sensor histidine kinase